VTRTKGQSTEDYRAWIVADPLARLVKLADIDDNCDEERLAALPEATADWLRPSTLVTALRPRAETTTGRVS